MNRLEDHALPSGAGRTGSPAKGLFAQALIRVGFLFLALAVAFSISAPLGFWLGGWGGLTAAAFAALVCLIAGSFAEIAQSLSAEVLVQVLLGMSLRAALPLGCCLLLIVTRHPLVQSGVVFQLLAFYLVTLVVESLLAVGRLRRRESIGSL